MANEDIKQRIVQEVKEIPPLPDIVVKVMQITRNPEASAEELTKVISQDQALTGNILRLCNSAYYGLPRVVSSLTQAIMYLGFHTVRSLVLTCSVSNLLNSDRKIYGYEDNGIWKHTVATAMISEFLAKKYRSDVSDTVFTAGLLHDIGQLILGTKIEDTADTIVDLITETGIGELEAENEALGVTHTEIGSMLADNWNFPEELVHAIRYHHDPEEPSTKSIHTSIVHIADTLALEMGYGIELEQMKYPVTDFALKAVGIKKTALEKYCEEVRPTIEESADQFVNAVSG